MLRTPHRFIVSSGLALLLVLGARAWAGPRGTGPSENKPPPPKSAPPTGKTEGGRGGTSGSQAKGTVNEYAPAKDSASDDDTLVATLKIQPTEKGAHLVSLRVHNNSEFRIGVAKLDPETAAELLWKGLFVTATYEAEPANGKKKAPTQKSLKTLNIDLMDLEGTIQEIGNDYMIVSAKPMAGKDWPDAEAPKTGTPSATLAKSVKARALKLKTLDKITQYRKPGAGAAGIADPGDFTVGQKVEVTAGIGKGKVQGILGEIRPPVQPNPGEKRETGPRPPAPPKPSGGTRKPGG